VQHSGVAATHLSYYREHGISPVHQDISDLQKHFGRRGALYRLLSLLPAVFRDRRILEVAPGGGHNSLYVASLRPARYVLVEPNETAQAEIRRLYASLAVPYTTPELQATTLQQFDPPSGSFDVVICENWLGNAPAELALLRKLGGFVAPDGAIVVTTVSPLGIVPNLIRKSLGLRFVAGEADFSRRAQMLVRAFGPHLSTMSAMSRPHVDWVMDNPLNPAYCGVCLSMLDLLDQLGDGFAILRSVPDFSTEWRWYKTLEIGKGVNATFRDAYARNIHNFIDHLAPISERDGGNNLHAEALARDLVEAVRSQETGDSRDTTAVVDALNAVLRALDGIEVRTLLALKEGRDLLGRADPSVEEIASAPAFSRLFGRETQYVSLTRL
jgi:predicted O-methyltransferase YrrM